MPWYIFALGAALLSAAAAVTEKVALRREHALQFSAVLAVINLGLTAPLLATVDFGSLNPKAVWLMYAASLVGTLAFYLVTRAVRHLEVSETSPFLILGPGVTALVAWFVIGETLSAIQVSGIALLIVGVYVLELQDGGGLIAPFRAVLRSRYLILLLAALLLYGLCGTFDRFTLSRLGVSPTTYIALIHPMLALNFIIALVALHGWRDLVEGFKAAGWWVLLVGLFTVGYRWTEVNAMAMVPVALVVAIKRTSGFFSALIGGELFHEHNLPRKLAACVILLGGALLVVLS